MTKPLVSIIIPTFNRAHLIGETLDSIIAQAYTNWECIIVDDGSSDNTDELIDAYQKRDMYLITKRGLFLRNLFISSTNKRFFKD